MSRTRIVKGNITKITEGDYKVYSKGDISYNAAGSIRTKAGKGTIYSNKVEEPPKVSFIADYILHSEWRNHLDKPIKRAIYEQDIIFVVKIDIEKLKQKFPDQNYYIEFDVYDWRSKNENIKLPLSYRNKNGEYNKEWRV